MVVVDVCGVWMLVDVPRVLVMAETPACCGGMLLTLFEVVVA